MPNYAYRVRDHSGQQQLGLLEADSQAAAVDSLRSRQLFIVEVKPAAGAGMLLNLGSLKNTLGRSKVKSRDLAVFCRQFSTMIDAGLPLLTSLDILKSQTSNRSLKVTIQDVRSKLEQGDTLAEALRAYPRIFPPILVNMVEAGEVGGALDQVMSRLAVHFEKEHEIVQKVKSALTYPAAVFVVAVLAIIFLLTFVLPTFKDILTDMGVPLPVMTRMVLGLSDFFRRFFPLIMLLLTGAGLAINRYLKTEQGRFLKDHLLLRMPIVGEILSKMIISRFSSTLGTMLKGGVPILQAMEVVKRTVGNMLVINGVEKAQTAIRDGQGMSKPLAECGVFPPMVIHMITIGEETGTLDNLLERLSVFYDQEVDTMVSRLSSMIEPLMIVGLGGTVGFIVISILLPMFSLLGTISQ